MRAEKGGKMVRRTVKFAALNPRRVRQSGAGALAGALLAGSASATTLFTPGDLVISTVTCQVCTATNSGLDTASPIMLDEFALGAGGTSATSVGSLTLPQLNSGANSAISGEYGSASEGILQLSADGHYLTIMGYGVNANTFNT